MKRLEQLDSYITEFKSTITEVREEKGAFLIALTESAFYPTSGGQSFDTGTLNGRRVLETFKEEKTSATVWHKVQTDSFKIGDSVHGVLDWERRYKHMQRHSGEHMLAQAFVRVSPAFQTQSVNLEHVTCTIDISGEPKDTDILSAENIVNEAGYQNLAIKAFEVDESELSQYPLRRTPKVSGKIRIVHIGDYDYSACGGTHLRSSAEALPIKIIASEKIKGSLTRIYFMAGSEALTDYQTKHRVSGEVAKSFSSSVEKLPERVTQLRDELKATKQQLEHLQLTVAKTKAQELLQTAHVIEKGRIITHELSAEESSLLVPLSKFLGTHDDVIALLGATGERASLLFIRGKKASAEMNTLLNEVLYLIQGKGGGSVERAQGNGTDTAGVTQALEYARMLLSSR
ncbi:MAG: alanyl-tRNA editing protein [Trueperaceae bacterium]